ncbi:MAG: transaldolase family protein [Armatimonadota bacterium]
MSDNKETLKNDLAVHGDEKLIALVHDLALRDYQAPGSIKFGSKEKYVWLRQAGSLIWLDTGDASAAEKVWSDEATALTTNNTLVNAWVKTGIVDEVIPNAAKEIRSLVPNISEQELIYEIGFLLNAKLALSLVQKFGVHVSVELHPDMAFDIMGTLAFARRYYAINPEHFFVKVPMTEDGLVSVRTLSKEQIPVNFTIGFSARQNYLAARFANPSYVNVFLGRLNSVVEANSLGSSQNIGERATLASDEMIKNLRESGAAKTNQIAASIRSGGQVAALAGIDVLTIPPKSAGEYLALDMKHDDMSYTNWRDLPIQLQPNGPVQPHDFDLLWEIEEKFISYVNDVVKHADTIMNGYDLKQLANQHEVNLFHDWTVEERKMIREQGKIPQTANWPGIALDTLMSMAALESFTQDQIEVDTRIRNMIG